MLRLIYGLIFILLIAESGMSFMLAMQFYFSREANRESRRLAAVFFGICVQGCVLISVSLLRTIKAPLTLSSILGVGILVLVIPLTSMTLDSVGLLPRWKELWKALWYIEGRK